jgi:tRNA(Ile2) C34 agmatinyltransferase TiaS
MSNPRCPACGDELCSSELEFHLFCAPCGDKLAELVDEADDPDDWTRLQQETQ